MSYLSLYKQHNLLYTQEPISRYRHGGYHPVNLGDSFNNDRYKVYHKLGWGGYSTVWLAKDRRQDLWVALKIVAAEPSEEYKEFHNSQLLHEALEAGPSAKPIVHVIDSFMHDGPNGAHRCIVFELLGPSAGQIIAAYTRAEDDMPKPSLVVRMAEQLLEALTVMHHAGMAHGDINSFNIAFRCTNLSAARTDRILEVLGEPYQEELERLDGKPLAHGLPKYIIQATDWEAWFDEENEDLCILDLGQAFAPGNEPESLVQLGALQAPEIFFTGRFNHTVDLWSAGCVIHSFVFNAYPFMHLGDDNEVLVAQMIAFAEELPEEWREQWDEMRKKSSRREFLKETEGIQNDELEKKFKNHIHDPTLAILLPVIQGLMRFRPSDRLSASEGLSLLRSKKTALSDINLQA